jgi:hypothetical protein
MLVIDSRVLRLSDSLRRNGFKVNSAELTWTVSHISSLLREFSNSFAGSSFSSTQPAGETSALLKSEGFDLSSACSVRTLFLWSHSVPILAPYFDEPGEAEGSGGGSILLYLILGCSLLFLLASGLICYLIRFGRSKDSDQEEVQPIGNEFAVEAAADFDLSQDSFGSDNAGENPESLEVPEWELFQEDSKEVGAIRLPF